MYCRDFHNFGPVPEKVPRPRVCPSPCPLPYPSSPSLPTLNRKAVQRRRSVRTVLGSSEENHAPISRSPAIKEFPEEFPKCYSYVWPQDKAALRLSPTMLPSGAALVIVCLSGRLLLAVKDHLPTPRLSFEPPSPVYISGEPVTLRCAHPEADGVVGYRFYRDDAEAPVGGGSPSEPTYRMAGAREEEAGWYSCLYQSEVRGRVIRSMRSARHLLAITAQPPAPSLTLQPAYPVYITGEPVTMGCASPGPAAVTGYRFYKDGREVTERPGASPRDYVISGVSGQTAGTYRCIYWTGERGRDIPAVPSTPVAVVVIDPLRPPAFSLTPSDGRVGDGENLTLACSAPAGSGNVQMLFLRDGEVVHRGQSPNRTERNFRFSFRAMRGNASHVGNYSCYYEADVRGRLLISPQSSPRQVTVEAPKLLWLVIIGLGAGLGSLLLAVLLILLCRARLARTGAKTDQSSPVPHEDGEIAYTALTVSTLTSTRSAP
ncbi:Fc receptor-like protein 6 isoform X3 [Rhinatrema bivittatum]|uniref:Fc receptor-like protein 6 isoform X3 n=1 Tax=Rhinatrema bivittatum TaxID=194408 RepID=UPI001129A848|nr:Fc receptor-like protein 6 isoform X3 [Rhinatrema bivittatum]